MNDESTAAPPDDHPWFAVAAKRLVRFTGSGWAVAIAGVLFTLWVGIGFAVDFSRPWELMITVGVPVLSLGLLIVVQHTQNHDNLAMQLKLDELIRALEGGHDAMIRVEDASAEHLERLERDFKAHLEEAGGRGTA